VALNEFEGTVMLVSHDRALLRAVCDEFWLVSNGGIEPFDGDLDDYQRYLLDEAKRQRENLKLTTEKTNEKSAKTETKSSGKKTQSTPDHLKPLRRELEKVESRMAELNLEGAALEKRMAAILHPHEIAEAGKRFKAVSAELAQLEEKWLDLSSQLETLSQAPV
jgi:ATP-binding cassette subfamily F protein 3